MANSGGMEGAFLAIGIGCGLAMGAAINAENIEPSEAQKRVIETQDFNYDIRTELESQEVGHIGRLILDTETNTYTFILDTSKNCEGTYEISENGRQAMLAGEPDCN